MNLTTRYLGLNLRTPLVASASPLTLGIDNIEMVMVGAAVTMVCSALARNGIGHLRTLETGIAEWLEQHGYESLAEIKGMMSQQNCPDRSAFERAQYVHSLATFMDDPSCIT